MEVYSLTETCGNAGCYGVFSTLEKATAKAMEFIKSWEYGNAEETVFDGFHKCIYYGENESAGCFEIWKHKLDR